MEFMRMRSPSRAPPPRRLVGSMASTAMRSLSSWSRRKRRTSSSVSDDLPEPPVPVMPSDRDAAGGRRPVDLLEQARVEAPELEGGDGPGQRPLVAREQGIEIG